MVAEGRVLQSGRKFGFLECDCDVVMDETLLLVDTGNTNIPSRAGTNGVFFDLNCDVRSNYYLHEND